MSVVFGYQSQKGLKEGVQQYVIFYEPNSHVT